MIARTLRKYFWDVNPSTLDLESHKQYIIERILDLGDEAAISWLRQKYSADDILAVAGDSRRLSPKSKNFWTQVAHQL